MRLVYVFVMVLYLFVCFRRLVVKVIQHREYEKRRVYLFQRQETKLDCHHGAADQETYRVDICDRNTSFIACNEHIQTVMGKQKKIQNLRIGPLSNQCYGPKMGR